MRDLFALAVMVLGIGVMAYGFARIVMAQSAVEAAAFWDVALVLGGLAAACIGGYAVGRSVAVDGAWDRPSR